MFGVPQHPRGRRFLNGNSFFGVYENALPAEFCRQVIGRFDEDPRVEVGRVGNGTRQGAIDQSVKKTTEISLADDVQGWEDVIETLFISLQRYVGRYMRNWGRAFSCGITQEPLKIARYPVGGHFDWHSDNLGSGVTTRVITAMWYLNTVEQGGETEYPWQKMTVQPVEGRMLLCPVGWTYVHRGAPPISNPKYIAITQLHQAHQETI